MVAQLGKLPDLSAQQKYENIVYATQIDLDEYSEGLVDRYEESIAEFNIYRAKVDPPMRWLELYLFNYIAVKQKTI